MAVAPDGRRAAAAGGDGAVRFWDLPDLEPAGALNAHDGRANCLAFSADGRVLVSGGEDRTLRAWDLTRPAAYVQWGPRLDQSRAALHVNPADARAVAAVARWYAFRGRWDWARELFGAAGPDAAAGSRLLVAHAHWHAADAAGALREFEAAKAADEAHDTYLDVCIRVVRDHLGV